MLENIKAALYRNEFNLLVQEFESLHTLYNAIIETRKCFLLFFKCLLYMQGEREGLSLHM